MTWWLDAEQARAQHDQEREEPWVHDGPDAGDIAGAVDPIPERWNERSGR